LKAALRFLLVLAVAGGGFWLWRILFPGDEAVIRSQLQELAEAASFGPNEAPLVKVTNAAKVANHFAVSTEIDLNIWDYQHVSIQGRDEVRQAAFGARNTVASLQVRVDDVEFIAGPAEGRATLRLTLTGSTSQHPEPRSQELQLDMEKVDGDWLIRRVTIFEYLVR